MNALKFLFLMFLAALGPNPANAQAPASDAALAIPDTDGDGVKDDTDNCAYTSNRDQADADLDGVGDACDTCEDKADPDQADGDGDGYGDVCDYYPLDKSLWAKSAGIVKGKVAKKAKHGVEPVCQIPVNPKEPAECLVGSASYADREACCILLESDYARCGIAALVSNMDPEDRIFQDSKDKAAVKPTQVEDCIAEPDSEKISKAKRLECCGHLQGGLRTQCTIGVTTMDRAVELMNRGTGCAGEAEDKP